MNFADSIKKTIKEYEELGDKKGVKRTEAINNIKKTLGFEDITEAIKTASIKLADETEDPSVLLVGLMININVLETLFPEDEINAYIAAQDKEEK